MFFHVPPILQEIQLIFLNFIRMKNQILKHFHRSKNLAFVTKNWFLVIYFFTHIAFPRFISLYDINVLNRISILSQFIQHQSGSTIQNLIHLLINRFFQLQCNWYIFYLNISFKLASKILSWVVYYIRHINYFSIFMIF
jgi:hypothetical protein